MPPVGIPAFLLFPITSHISLMRLAVPAHVRSPMMLSPFPFFDLTTLFIEGILQAPTFPRSVAALSLAGSSKTTDLLSVGMGKGTIPLAAKPAFLLPFHVSFLLT